MKVNGFLKNIIKRNNPLKRYSRKKDLILVYNMIERDCMKNIQGFLIDLDGVLYIGNRTVDGAKEAIEYLKENGIHSGVFPTLQEKAGILLPVICHHWVLRSRKAIFSHLHLLRLHT